MQVPSPDQEHPREEEMATPFSILPSRIPWTEEPGGLQSVGSQRVRHDCSDLSCTTFTWLPRWLSSKKSTCQCRRPWFDAWVWRIPWRRKWQPTQVFLPGTFHGQRRLVGYTLWGRKGSDTTELLSTQEYDEHSSLVNGLFMLHSIIRHSLAKRSISTALCSYIHSFWKMFAHSGLGRSPGEGNGNPLQYSCLENSMGEGAW